jgi:hypothetical protein
MKLKPRFKSRRRLAVIGASLTLGTLFLSPGLARAETFTVTFGPFGLEYEHPWTVPPGVTAASVSLHGARGGGEIDFGGGAPGGNVYATLQGLTPGTGMAVCLGGRGNYQSAGAMGGGAPPLDLRSDGGGGFGGGGATDIRLSGNCSSNGDKRLLVAGGVRARP